MTRYEFDRERTLSELSEFGIGFSEGKPGLVPERKKRVRNSTLFVVTCNVLALAFVSAVAVGVCLGVDRNKVSY